MSDLITTATAPTWTEALSTALARARSLAPYAQVVIISIVAMDDPTYGDPHRTEGYQAAVTVRATREADDE